jgi:polysaccharide export outer membrane protein
VPSKSYASVKQVEAFGASAEQEYRLGPGDKFAFVVRGRPEISREEIVVSPDGEVALPRAGVVNVAGRSLKNVTQELANTLKQHYEDPEVTLVMKLFANNRVFVLGRVANPGAVPFNGRGSLLEALSLAGGLPVDTGKSFLSRCMIVRGSEMVVWVDLRDLLENGNMALNAKLQNGDVIFIPQSEDQLAYVMGQVVQPGVHVLRSSQTVLDAVMSRGGPSREADVSKVMLARQVQGRGMVEQIDLRDILNKGDMRKNYTLKDGDIVYVGESGASRINYYITRLLPSMQVVDFALRTAESTGALAELRRKLWGQEGFVGTGASTTPAAPSGK